MLAETNCNFLFIVRIYFLLFSNILLGLTFTWFAWYFRFAQLLLASLNFYLLCSIFIRFAQLLFVLPTLIRFAQLSFASLNSYLLHSTFICSTQLLYASLNFYSLCSTFIRFAQIYCFAQNWESYRWI